MLLPPARLQDPAQAADWLAESKGYAPAAAKLLSALPGTSGIKGNSADRVLRMAHSYVRAAGSPQQAQQLFHLLDSAPLGVDGPAMQADLALLLAHQALGLNPTTGLPLGGEEAAASVAAALEPAADVAAAVRSGSGSDDGKSGGHGGELLAAELAAYALSVYRGADNALGMLRCLAVLSSAGSRLPASHQEMVGELAEWALQAANLLFNAALNTPVRAPTGRGLPSVTTADVKRAQQQLEAAVGLQGLSQAGSLAAKCAQHDPHFPAIAAAFSAATAPAAPGTAGGGSSAAKAAAEAAARAMQPRQQPQPQPPPPPQQEQAQQVQLVRRKQSATLQAGGVPAMPKTVLSCSVGQARQALAWWVHSLAISALMQHLRQLGGAADSSASLADLKAIEAAAKVAREAIALVEQLRAFHVMCQQCLPLLAPPPQRRASYLAVAAAPDRGPGKDGPLLQELHALESALLNRLAEAVFPAGGAMLNTRQVAT